MSSSKSAHSTSLAAMDEAEEILLNSLKRSGVSLPVAVSSIKDFSPDALVSICSQSLCLILNCADASFPTWLPDSTAYRFKICADVASAIKSLGYLEELSFHQFLYPSDEEVLKLVRFLVERLSEESSQGISVEKYNSAESSTGTTEALAKFCRVQLSGTSNLEDDSESNKSLGSIREETIHDLSQRVKNCADEQDNNPSLRLDNINKLRNEIKDLEGQEKLLMDEMHDKALTLQKLQDKHEILKAALDLVKNDKKSMELHIKEVDAKVKSKQQRIIELETQSNVAEHSTKQSKDHEMLVRLKEIKQGTDSTLAEISKLEAQRLDLLMELRKQPKLPSRKSYIKRVTEITKNSRKLDTDIQQILKETRQLQLESNAIQERLHRTYAVVDEMVLREAKTKEVGRKAYGLLTRVHDSFGQIADTILATDRARREAAEWEAKLASLSSRSFDITKLQADLDYINKENELLEQLCHDRGAVFRMLRFSAGRTVRRRQLVQELLRFSGVHGRRHYIWD